MKRMNYSNFKQGDVVSAPILYSDFMGTKVRPALVVSQQDYNKGSDDIVVLKITSKGGDYPFDVFLDAQDLESGEMKRASTIQTDFPVVIEKRTILQTIGKVKDEKLAQVKQKMREFYEL